MHSGIPNPYEPPQSNVEGVKQPSRKFTNEHHERVIRKWAIIFITPFLLIIVLFVLVAVLSFMNGLGKNVIKSSLTSDFISFCFSAFAIYFSTRSLCWRRPAHIFGIAGYALIHGSIWYIIYISSWLLAHGTLAKDISVTQIGIKLFQFSSFVQLLIYALLVIGIIHWRLLKIDCATSPQNTSAA